jgi:hypothetical protein
MPILLNPRLFEAVPHNYRHTVIKDRTPCQTWLSAKAAVIDIGMQSFNISKFEPDHKAVIPIHIPNIAPRARKWS